MDADLRERVKRALWPLCDTYRGLDAAADALAPIIAEVEAAAVDRCAVLADDYDNHDPNDDGALVAARIAAAIRAQKEPSA